MDAATGWTDDRVATLAKLWGEGLSASQIAAALGGGVTRNAVIGKVHRLGLSGRVKAGAPAPQRPAKPKSISPGQPASEPSRTPADQPGTAPAETAVDHRWARDIALPESKRVGILDLRDSMCKWPIGDPSKPDFAFCGARASSSLPYCAEHCRIAYQPAAERRRLRA